ncbi:hypothetical protein [Lacicoccus alkaliphilus]|uniref:hypothetical protein n=1 Tax=Lacicoccus alkaliphilus TaxID=148453 RepID=UPI0039F0F67C
MLELFGIACPFIYYDTTDGWGVTWEIELQAYVINQKIKKFIDMRSTYVYNVKKGGDTYEEIIVPAIHFGDGFRITGLYG